MSCDGLALTYLGEYVGFYALDIIQHLKRYSLMQQDFPLCPFLCNPQLLSKSALENEDSMAWVWGMFLPPPKWIVGFYLISKQS